MLNNCLNSIWSLSENYLDVNNTHSIVSSGRDKVVLYKSEVENSKYSKILHVASFALVFPLLFSFILSKGFRQIFPYKECKTSLMPAIEKSNCEAIATKDCEQTQEWRKKLIQSAEHNIVISGSYCGGESFDNILDCINLRMKEIPELKVVIITHPKFLTAKNKKKIINIKKEYNNNFTLVSSPDSYFGAKKITNHTKCTIIDYGNYFMQGGSGIKDNFVGHGVIQSSNIKLADKKIQDDIIVKKTLKKVGVLDDIDLTPSRPKINKKNRILLLKVYYLLILEIKILFFIVLMKV